MPSSRTTACPCLGAAFGQETIRAKEYKFCTKYTGVMTSPMVPHQPATSMTLLQPALIFQAQGTQKLPSFRAVNHP